LALGLCSQSVSFRGTDGIVKLISEEKPESGISFWNAIRYFLSLSDI